MATADQSTDLITDIVIPSVILLVTFIINGFVFAYIMMKRRKIVYEEAQTAEITDSAEMLEEQQPTTSRRGLAPVAQEEVAIELDEL